MKLKMIIVLDKICLAGVIAISVCVGYKAGVMSTQVKKILNDQTGLHEVGKE